MSTPPTLTIPPFEATAIEATSFGPTGTPRLPDHRPGWTPPPTAAQLADPRDPCHCPRHDPAAGFTRNTLGHYGSAVPACTGCRRGDQDAIESAIVADIQRDEGRLRDLLRDGHPSADTDAILIITQLVASIEALEAYTTELPTAPEYARRAIAIARTANVLYTFCIDPEPSLSEYYDAYMAHKATLDRFTPATFTGTTAANRLFTG